MNGIYTKKIYLDMITGVCKRRPGQHYNCCWLALPTMGFHCWKSYCRMIEISHYNGDFYSCNFISEDFLAVFFVFYQNDF